MHQHTRRHHRYTQRLWRRRRMRTMAMRWNWLELRPQDVGTHALKHLLGKKTKYRCRVEERRFRQQVRRAIHHGDPIPRYRHDWAD